MSLEVGAVIHNDPQGTWVLEDRNRKLYFFRSLDGYTWMSLTWPELCRFFSGKGHL